MNTTKKYASEDLNKKIYKLRTHKNLSWKEIRNEIEKDFNQDINECTLKKYYEDYVSRAQVITASLQKDKRRAKGIVIDWNSKFLEKFNKIDKTLNKQMERVTDMLDKAYNEGNEKKYVFLLRSLLAVSKDLQNQLSLIKRQQERMIVNQKNAIYSPLQIMNIINKEMKKSSDNGESKFIIDKEGKIKKKIN